MDKAGKKNPLLRALAFLLTLVLVLGAVFLVANWQKLNFDFVRRYFTYRNLARNENGQVESFSYIGGSSSSFAQLGSDLLVCSQSGVRLYSESGGAYIDQTSTLKNPLTASGGGTALVYDAGGTQLYVYRDRELIFSLTGEEGPTILSASLNSQGLLTLVTQSSGVRGAVTVYNASFQPQVGVNLSSRFVTDALLSPDGRTLAVATSGQTGGTYNSQIAFYRVEQLLASAGGEPEPDYLCDLGNNTILKLDWSGQVLRVLGENALVFVDGQGTQTGSYSYGRQLLKGYSLSGDDYCSLLLGRNRAGSDATLVTVDLTGEELASLEMEKQVLSLSSASRYLSVLTADGLTIYTDDLEPYHVLSEPQGTRKVLQRADGSVTLISGETVRLYLPD